jgi:YVTN family beta-propeller protein
VVFVGGPSENTATAGALDTLRAPSPAGLASGGYELAAGDFGGIGMIALSGVDTDGTFYAAQTLRQLVVATKSGHALHDLAIRDWPAAPLRGVIEGFYGPPWSTADRLSQFDFYAATKQNIYVYSPKDDPYLRAQWRDPYPADQLAVIKQLVTRATQDHVKFTYALSPGLSVCYSSDSDEQALVTKFDSMYAIGVRSFSIPLDDISYTNWNCAADKTKFGIGGAAAGTAQSYLLNRIQQDFIAKHPDVAPLQMVPTEYSDVADSPYKTAIRTDLDQHVVVGWTGVGVIAPVITSAQTKAAKQVYGHQILIWDNYPVNDYVTDRLLLGPYVGRDPAITGEIAGLTANPMIEAEPSKIAEFTSGDFLWNPAAYNAADSWEASLRSLGGSATPWLKVFAENNYSSRIDTTESPTLTPLIAALWQAYNNHQDITRPAAALSAYFDTMAATPAQLRSTLDDPAFLTEVQPWLDKLGQYGGAGKTAVALLLAQVRGDSGAVTTLRAQLSADRTALNAIPQQVAVGVLDPFIYQVLLDTVPPLGPQVSFQPGSLRLKPGASAPATVRLNAPDSASAVTVSWRATPSAGLTVTPASGSVSVPAHGSATVSVTVSAPAPDTAAVRQVVVTGTASAGAPVVDSALPVQVSSGTGSTHVLIANYSEPTVTDVDVATGKPTAVPTGINPGEVVTSQDGTRAYTADQGSNTVSVIDVATSTRVATVKVGDIPSGEAITPDGKTLWVADYGDDTVQPIDTATNAAGPPLKVGGGPENMAISPDGSTLWVADRNDNAVTAVDLATKTAGAEIPAGAQPFNVVVSPDGSTAYVSDSGASAVTPIDTAKRTALPTLQLTESGTTLGLAISPDGSTLWVTTGDEVARLDTATGREAPAIDLGNSPDDIGLDWNGATAYVACDANNTLIPVDSATGKAAPAITTGAYPIAVAATGVPLS